MSVFWKLGGNVGFVLPVIIMWAGGTVSFFNEVLVLMSVFVDNCQFQCQFLSTTVGFNVSFFWKLGGNVGFVLPVIIMWAGGNVSFLNEVLVSMSVFVDNCRFQCQFLWKSGGNVGFVLLVIIMWAGGNVSFHNESGR